MLARDIKRPASVAAPEASPGSAGYPWEEHGLVVTPCEYPYPNVQRQRTPEGQRSLKLVKDAIARFSEMGIH